MVLRSRDLAELAGTTPRALRHYHHIGLLEEPPRDQNGYRRYGPDHLVRVLRIKQLSASGVTLRKIATLLAEHTHDAHQLFDKLERELQDRAVQIDEQRRMLAQLRSLSLPKIPNSGALPSKTSMLDRHVWTVLTATDDLDNET